ncbi:adenosine receptor A1 [Lingula anatina]|uniref:Adenosine receptor A1 n=1 Tax=Lingula anatina TaxID=7574 RepID=A0A1S3HZA4_LINAN|nr:adenosine receptor A1 [Lingula anatina]|eukprot:XP_013390414.1 adenosine receptor A1 [Lingula anatina]
MSNNSTEGVGQKEYTLLWQIYLAAELLIAVVAIFGNSLVIYVVLKNRRLRTVTNYFITNLALADLLVGLIGIPFAILSDNNLPRDFYGCLLVNSMLVVLTQSSIFSLLAIALERFAAIKSPFKYQALWTKKLAMILNALTWIFSILIGLVPVFGWNLGQPDKDGCRFTEVIDMKYMVYFNFFICVLIPLIIMLLIYGYIFNVVRKQNHQIAALEIKDSPADHTHRRAFRRELKAAKSLSVVIGLFALSWLPLHILNTLTLLCSENCKYPYELLLAAIILSHANSAVNPFIYAYTNSRLHGAIAQVFGCKHTGNYTSSDDIPTVSRRSNAGNHFNTIRTL